MRHLLLLGLVALLAGCPRAPVEATPTPVSLEARLEAHVRTLEGPRNDRHPERYEAARRYLTEQLKASGYQVTPLPYPVGRGEAVNLEAVRPGDERVLVIGAHYDTAHGTPGADDNASGCAVLLELARLTRASEKGPTVRFLLFANEEPDHFFTDTMGSLVYARACQQRGDRLMGMLSLECVGFYSDEPGSQNFPPEVTGYPDAGNFVAFISDLSSEELMTTCKEKCTGIAGQGLAAPPNVRGIALSDHWSFWQCGYQAVMVTDTAFFRNPNYHARTDTVDTLDFPRMAGLVEGLKGMVESL